MYLCNLSAWSDADRAGAWVPTAGIKGEMNEGCVVCGLHRGGPDDVSMYGEGRKSFAQKVIDLSFKERAGIFLAKLKAHVFFF